MCAVSSSKMSAVVDDLQSGVDPEAEVKKLQDLVKKLERQNQILRTKQNQRDDESNVIISAQTDSVDKDFDEKLPKSSWNTPSDSGILKDGVKNLSLDDIELLDVENVLSDDEEDSWLFSSPKRPSLAQRNVSPYQWMRSELEHPKAEVKSCKKSLFIKLDEVTRFPRSPSADTIGSASSPANTPSPATKSSIPQDDDSSGRATAADDESQDPGSVPIIRPPLLGLGSRVDTNTFTRPKKQLSKSAAAKKEPLPTADSTDALSDDLTSSISPRSSPRERSPRLVTPPREDENANSTSQSSTEDYKLADVVDVQVLARMQEESLRQSFNSPYTSPRKSALSRSLNINRSTGGLLDSLENNGPARNTNRASPARHDGDLYQSGAHRSNNSLGELSSNSSSPPGSPYGSQYLDQKSQSRQDAHRRSLPNLHKSNQLSLASHGSDSRLSSRASPQRQLQAPSQRVVRTPGSAARTQSPGRTASPQRSGIPGPRRAGGIPRPGSASKLPAPRKSSIPSRSPVRRPITTPRTNDESWKDGCF